jgi:hypothetical protein
MSAQLQAAILIPKRFHYFPSWLAGRLVIGLLALAACCVVPVTASAAGTLFTDANWVSLPKVIVRPTTAIMDSYGNLIMGGSGISEVAAEWNGGTWTALGSVPAFGTAIYGLACDRDGNIYASGVSIGGEGNGVAMWNGSTWSVPGRGISINSPAGCYALACDAVGNIYVGGYFSNGGGVGANNIAEWDGTNWYALGSGVNGSVNALAVDGLGNLYAAGAFSMAGGVSANNIAKWDGQAWSALGSGMDYYTSNYTPALYALACDASGNVYAGGRFTVAGGTTASNIAMWNGTNWSALGQGLGGPYYVKSLALDGHGNLYAGMILFAPGVAPPTNANVIAKWNGADWSALGSGISGPASPGLSVNSLVFDSSGNLYVVGSFSTAGTNATLNTAKALLSGPLPNQLMLDQPGPGTDVITYLGTPGDSYALDFAADLNPPINWMPQTTNITSTNSATTAGYLTFTNLSGAPQAFYRVKSVP